MRALSIGRSTYRARHLAKSHQNRPPRAMALAAAGATTLTLAAPAVAHARSSSGTAASNQSTAKNATPKTLARASALMLAPQPNTSSVPGPVIAAPHPAHLPDEVKAARVANERRAQDAREAMAERERLLGWVPAMKQGTYRFTSDYGMRWGRLHGGVDLAAPVGTPVYSMSAGEVTEVKRAGGYGNLLVIRYWDGTVSYYGHLQDVKVAKGDRVTKGQVVALSGNTGRSTGPHLHWEIRPPAADANPSTAQVTKQAVTTGAAGGEDLAAAAANDPYVQAGVQNPTVDPVPWLAQRNIRLAGDKPSAP